jgi:hypothetical protein
MLNQQRFYQTVFSLPNVAANGTCDVSSKGNTIFNTTDNKIYYCNGTNCGETTSGGFTLAYSATQASGFPLFKLKNTTNVGFYGESTIATGVVGQSGSAFVLITQIHFKSFFLHFNSYIRLFKTL